LTLNAQDFYHLENDSIEVPSYYKQVDGLLRAFNKNSNQYGIIDTFGKTLIPFEYSHIGKIRNKRFIAYKGDSYGVVDLNNDVLIPFIYDDLWSSQNIHFFYLKNGERGLRDLKKEYPLNIQGKLGGIIKDEIFIIKTKEGHFLLDSKGNKLLSKFDYLKYSTSADVIFARNDDKIGLISSKGKVIQPCIYKVLGKFKEGLALAMLNNKWGFIENTGNAKIPLIYDYATSFTGGRAIVLIDKKRGVIDLKGDYILEPKYDDLIPNTKDSLYLAYENKKYQLLDYKFNPLSENIFDHVNRSYHSFGFTSDLCAVKKDSLYGFINRSGEYVIKPQFKKVKSFDRGYAITGKYPHYGLIDKKGKVVLPEEYRSISIKYKNEIIARTRETSTIVLTEPLRFLSFDGLVYTKRGNLVIIEKDEIYSLVHINGTKILDDNYSNIEIEKKNKVVVSKGGLKGLYDYSKKEFVLPIIYDKIKIWYGGGAIIVKSMDDYGLFNEDVKVVIEPTAETIDAMTYGVKVKNNGKFGLYSKSSKKILDVKYDSLEYLGNQKYKVSLDGKEEIISTLSSLDN